MLLALALVYVIFTVILTAVLSVLLFREKFDIKEALISSGLATLVITGFFGFFLYAF